MPFHYVSDELLSVLRPLQLNTLRNSLVSNQMRASSTGSLLACAAALSFSGLWYCQDRIDSVFHYKAHTRKTWWLSNHLSEG